MRKLIPVIFLLAVLFSCSEEDKSTGPLIENRDSLPILKSVGVSTLISDSGIIRYKIIAEDWFIYDKTTPSYWAMEKGLFIERFDESYHVEAFISCDTAYYYDKMELWELRGRVFVKNLKGEYFKTELLFWDHSKHLLYSDRYMEIKGETQELSGYDFKSNESMTQYSIHSSKGAFPVKEESTMPKPDPGKMAEYADTSSNQKEKETTPHQ